MRPEGALQGRPLAQHGAPLLARLQAAEPLHGLAAAAAFPGERVARALAARLGRLTGSAAIEVSYAPADGGTARGLEDRVGPLAANCLYIGVNAGAAPLLVSIPADAILRLLDRAFGGRGEAPDPLPRTFPLSSELLIERIETFIGEALSAALELPEDAELSVARRDGSLARLAPFAPDEVVEVHQFTVSDGADWTLLLAFPVGGPATFTAPEPIEEGARSASANDPAAAPFDAIPLTLNAVLVDTQFPLERLARLKVGDVLAVSVARNVPVWAGNKRIAFGAIGSFDDRVALQITQAF